MFHVAPPSPTGMGPPKLIVAAESSHVPCVGGVVPEAGRHLLEQPRLHALSPDPKLLEQLRPDRERPLVRVADVDLRIRRPLDPPLFCAPSDQSGVDGVYASAVEAISLVAKSAYRPAHASVDGGTPASAQGSGDASTAGSRKVRRTTDGLRRIRAPTTPRRGRNEREDPRIRVHVARGPHKVITLSARLDRAGPYGPSSKREGDSAPLFMH